MYAPLPARYGWLAREEAPRVLVTLLGLHGLKEGRDDAMIVRMAREIGVSDYRSSAIPWCGVGLGYAVRLAGYALPSIPERASSWTTWGEAVDEPMLGDVLVFRRVGGGHVGMYVGEDAESYHVLGCNQGDECSISRYGRAPWRQNGGFGVIAARRSPWRIAQPTNVRKIFLDAAGPTGASVV